MTQTPVRTFAGLLVAVSAALVIAGIAVVLFLNPLWVGFEQSRAGASALTGYTPEQVRTVTDGVLHDLVIGPPAFDQTVNGVAVFDGRERAHLVDVRAAFTGFGVIVLLALVMVVVSASVLRGDPLWRRSVGRGAVGLAVVILVAAVIAAVAFDQAFEVFHELLFASGTYSFNPTTERLVQLLPDQLWSETTLAVGGVMIAIAGVVAWWGLRGPHVCLPAGQRQAGSHQ